MSRNLQEKFVTALASGAILACATLASATLARAGTAEPASAAAPAIVSGAILTPTVHVTNKQEFPTVSLKVSAPGGIASCTMTLTSPAGIAYTMTGCNRPPNTTSGTFRISTGPVASAQVPFGPSVTSQNEPIAWLQGGTYTITGAQLTDYSGNFTDYSQQQLAAIFGGTATITVVNHGAFDVQPPVAVSASIKTKTVSLSARLPYVEVALDETVGAAGVAYVNITAVCSNCNGALGVIYLAQNYPVPAPSGTVEAFANLNTANATAGTYTIQSLALTDAAGNAVTYFQPSSLFGGQNSFTVTN